MTCINTQLLPIKAHYLLFYAGVAPVVLFMPTYAKQIGFSSVLVGTIYTVLPMVGMLSKPLMGAVADRFHCHKILVIILLLVTGCSWFCLQFIPSAGGEIKGVFTCSNEDLTRITICSPEEKPEKCVDYKLISEHQHTNNIITCTMECFGTSDFHKELCSWGFNEYCSANITEKEIHFNTHLQTTTVKKVRNHGKECMAIEVEDLKALNNSKENPTCSKPYNTSCRLTCDSVVLAKYHGNVQDEKLSHNYRFWTFLLLMIAGWIGLASISNLGDTICFGIIGDSTVDYGNQRLWGSAGWGFTSIFSGLLMDAFSDGKSDKNYTPLFYMVALFLGMDAINTKTITETKRVRSPSFLNDIGKLFLDIRIIIFIIWCMLAGTFNGLIGNFLFWHLEELADCPDEAWIKTLEGLYIFIQGFGGEIPFFFINGFLLRTIGHINCMSLVLFAFALKFLFYSIITNPWYVLPIGLLNGITFSTFYATMVSHAAAVAAPGTEATVQGLVSALYEGIGVSFGSFLAGILLYYIDGTTVFQIYGIVAIAMCIIHVIIQYFLRHDENLDVSGTENGKDPAYSGALYAIPSFKVSSLLILDDQSV